MNRREQVRQHGGNVILVAELERLLTWPPRTRWGRWRLTRDHKALEYRLRKPAGEVYYVLLSDCRTRDGALLWITHLAGKPWMTDADLGCFVRALIDLHGRLERIEEEA